MNNLPTSTTALVGEVPIRNSVGGVLTQKKQREADFFGAWICEQRLDARLDTKNDDAAKI